MYKFLFLFFGGMGNDIYLHTVGKYIFLSSMKKYIGKNSNLLNWKTQNAKNVGAFSNQLVLYEIKLIFMNYML